MPRSLGSPRGLLIGVLVAALVVVGVVVWRHEHPASSVPASALEVPERLGPEIFCTADSVQDCHDVTGSGTRVLVVGDSHVQMLVSLFRRLAAEHGWDLWFNERGGCAWQEGLTNSKQSEQGALDCAHARVDWYSRALPQIRPDVVVLLDRPRDDPRLWDGIVARRDGRQQPLLQAVEETTRQTLSLVARLVPHVLVVKRLDMPETFVPSQCLADAAAVSDCEVHLPGTPSATDRFVADVAATTPAVQPVDLNPAFCPGAPVCRVVAHGRPVFFDDHHYTAQYAASRADAVWRILRATGAF